jgi:Leucine-rich repeat (LRR) protein
MALNPNMRLNLSFENITSLDGIFDEILDKDLQQLYLQGNKIKNYGKLYCLTNLNRLYLQCNKIKQIGELSSLINLQYLNLHYNQIEDIRCLSSLTNLEELDLSYNQIKDIGGLSSLTNLQDLYLYHNQIEEIEGLSSLTNLQRLYLDDNQIKEIRGLSSLTNLQQLCLANNQIPYHLQKTGALLQRNFEISWKVVKPQFIRYCFTLAPLNLPVDILIMIFDVNSYPNHLYLKWEIGKTIKDAYQKYRKI